MIAKTLNQKGGDNNGRAKKSLWLRLSSTETERSQDDCPDQDGKGGTGKI